MVDTTVYIKGYGTRYLLSVDGKVWRGNKQVKVLNAVGDYPRVKLSLNGKQSNWLLHRLIAIHFIPNPDNFPEVNHKNGVKTDNRIENLEWCTTQYNIKHSWDTGLSKPTQNTFCKVTPQDVHDIYLLYYHGNWRQIDIAAAFGISKTIVWNVIHGRRWHRLKLKEIYEKRSKEENELQARKLGRERLERLRSTS